MPHVPSEQNPSIADLNDRFRRTFIGGRVMLTRGVATLPAHERQALITAVQTFEEFNPDNDPYGEHDFGAVEQGDERYFWKIDYYDRTLTGGSENPADPAGTVRVLLIMRADEY